MLDVLMLAKWDHSNTGWKFFKCLQYLGLNVLFFKGQMHPFMYPEQGVIHPIIAKKMNNSIIQDFPEFHQMANHAKVIHFVASTLMGCGVDLKKKHTVMNHNGANYRLRHESVNPIYNELIDAYVVQMPDLMGLGAKNEHLIYFPVDTDFIKPNFTLNEKRIIGHFPSMPTYKGTPTITKILNEFKSRHKFIYASTDGTMEGFFPWSENLIRMSQCDAIVEVFSPTAQDGRAYGQWGNTAFEAAALGKLVITNSFKQAMYLEEYGMTDCPLLIANTEDEIRERVEYVLTASPETIQKHKQQMRLWVEKYHSIPATADRLWEKIYKDFFNA